MAIEDRWMWCHKCQGLSFAADGPAGSCPAGNQHDHTGSGNYALVRDDPSVPGQDEWRRCRKCQALAFGRSSDSGNCAAGGKHDHGGSGNYNLMRVESGAKGQSQWNWCRRCQVMSFAGGSAPGPCAAGGAHDHTGSGNYVLAQVQDCTQLHSQVRQLEQQIVSIQNSPGYRQDADSPHPGRPDPEMLAEVEKLQAQLTPLARSYTACEAAKLALEEQLRLLPGPHHFGPSPFYVLGHNTNSIDQVNQALDQGANALEIDVTAFAHNLDAFCVDHAGPMGNAPGGASAPPLENFLRDLRKVADRRSELALVMFDLKPPASRPDLGPALIQTIRDILTKDSFLPVILSVSNITDEHTDRLIGSTVFDNIHGDYGQREGYMIDEEDDMRSVETFFLTKLKVDHYGYGNGTSFGPTDEGASGFRTPIELACWKRAAHGQPAFVDAWTVNNPANQALYLRIGVCGMISDPSGIANVRALLQRPEFAEKYRLARRTDNPMSPDRFEYGITALTSDIDHAGTDATITFTVTGERGSASAKWDTNLNARMERGQTSVVVMHAPDLGALKSVTVQSDVTGNAPNWHVHQIAVQSFRYGVNKTATFDTWINTTAPVTRAFV